MTPLDIASIGKERADAEWLEDIVGLQEEGISHDDLVNDCVEGVFWREALEGRIPINLAVLDEALFIAKIMCEEETISFDVPDCDQPTVIDLRSEVWMSK